MDKQQVVAGIKKNIVSILCGVAALAALGFMFFWINPRISSTDPGSVKQRVQARAAKAEEIRRLLSQQRPAPTFSTEGSAKNLPMFPTNRIIQVGRQAMDGVKAQANEVLAQAEELNRRTPLGWETYEAADADWPLEGEPKAAHRLRFRDEYARYVNADNSLFDPETGKYVEGTLQAALDATRAPTSTEMQSLEGGLEARLKNEVPLDATGNPIDMEDFQRRLAQGRVALASSMKYARARQAKIYIDPNGPDTGLSVHPLATTAQPNAVDCFNAQVGLWVQETIAGNLLRANDNVLSQLPADRQNILSAPVKHLVFVSVPAKPFGDAKAPPPPEEGGEALPQPSDTSAIRGGGKAPGEQEPAEQPPAEQPTEEQPVESIALIDPTVSIARVYSRSPSGRPANTPFYDLVQFRVILRCEAASVPYVLEELQASSFLSVVNMDMSVVDPAVAARQGYVYGDRPVVQLSLQCELPLLRSWLVPLMPADLQQGLAERGQAAQ